MFRFSPWVRTRRNAIRRYTAALRPSALILKNVKTHLIMDGFVNNASNNSKAPAMNDFVNKPLYEVSDPADQGLVPTDNDLSAAQAPTQEVQDLQDFEAWLMSTMFKCVDCGSEKHITGLCRQQDAMLRARLTMSVDDVKRKELPAREALKNGVPQGSPMCKMHAEKVAEKLEDSGLAPHAASPVPGTAAEGFIAQTALLPCCRQCFSNATKYERRPPYPPLDLCLCGIVITASDCWLCAIGRIEGTKSIACNDRGRADKKSDSVVACECNAEAKGNGARKCAGCGGIVTLPTKNFAGQDLQFTPGGLHPAIGLTAIQQQQQTPASPSSSGGGGGYQSVRALLHQHKVARNHRVFSTPQISQLRRMGLHIAAPVESHDVDAMTHPRPKLNALVAALRKPFVTLELVNFLDVLGICGFGVDDVEAIAGTFNGVFEGRVKVDNLAVVVSVALDSFEDPGLVGVPEVEGMFAAAEGKELVEEATDVEMADA